MRDINKFQLYTAVFGAVLFSVVAIIYSPYGWFYVGMSLIGATIGMIIWGKMESKLKERGWV